MWSKVFWGKVGDLLGSDYEMGCVISSHQALVGWNFCENTDLCEVLLVAKKFGEEGDHRRDVIVNLWGKLLMIWNL